MIKKYTYNFDFFKWIKKTELVQLSKINPEDDPIRPQLSNQFRTSQGRKIFGLKYNEEIEGVACIAFTTDIPATVKELELMPANWKVNFLFSNIPKILFMGLLHFWSLCAHLIDFFHFIEERIEGISELNISLNFFCLIFFI